MVPRPLLHVALVSPLPPPRGGMPTWTELLVKYAGRGDGLRLSIIDTSPRWRRVHQVGIPRRVVGGSLQLLRDSWRLWRTLWADRPAVLHLCTSGSLAFFRDVACLWLARCFGVPVVYHLHFGRIPGLVRRGSGWEWGLFRRAMRLADTVLAMDWPTLMALEPAFPAARLVHLPNCVDADELERITRGSAQTRVRGRGVRLVFIGWVIPTKGVLELVRAVRRLQPELALELELVGPQDPAYLRAVLDVGAPLGDSLRVRGELAHAEAMNTLRRADVLVLPSHTEGCPYVVLEAMALGKPVIATRVGAVPDLVTGPDGESCGLIVDPGDEKGLAQAIQVLCSDEGLLARMGASACSVFGSRYSVGTVFGRLREIWLSVEANSA